MSSLRDAIRWNNQGAKLLQSGDMLAANDLIRRAIILMQCASPTLCCDDESTESITPATSQSCNNPTNFEVSDGSMYVFQRPILIPTDIAMSSPDDNLDGVIPAVTTCFIFNLALVCHCYGIKTCSTPSLRCAMELYQTVLSIPFYDNVNLPITSSLMQCLALNNLVHLHHEFCEFYSGDQCFCCMLDLFWTMGCLDDGSFLRDEETRQLNLNLVYRSIHKYASAA